MSPTIWTILAPIFIALFGPPVPLVPAPAVPQIVYTTPIGEWK